ncbi:EAL domain-containing protein [Eubacterium multiforme]|uniref:Diguanylate cyclase (GGDEF)-like protein n=1 Tax=Eubacterium multiforme TaxID=83339 RepID=A0ABT9USU9_9FIRM|nr:bifunctional diguanylate cyclase/phosphodiesterase [Eubacterium multiforme]MDQ0149391.1 diguanylate cyclase (GGDEF)-like protein [Eubacterium multiforme]
MERNNIRINNKIIFIIIAYLIYLVSLILNDEFLYNATSIAIFSIVFYYFISAIKNIKKYKLIWISLFSCFCIYGFSDVIWLIYRYVYNIDPSNLELFQYIYTIVNVLITFSIIRYFMKNIEKFESAQLIIDIATIVVVMVSFSWTVIFDTKFKYIITDADYLMALIYVITDIISLSVIYIIYIYMARIRSKKSFAFLAIGVIVYSITDLFYIYEIINDLTLSSLPIDSLSIVPFIMFSLGCLYASTEEDKEIEKINISYNSMLNKKNTWILFTPLIALFFIGKLGVYWIIFFIIVIFLHKFLSYYITISNYNKYMLDKEREMNALLEKRVEERTKELSVANKKLKILSQKDVLSNLFNRRYFMEKLEEMILQKKEDEKIAVLCMDLNRFKFINDSYGHDIGDKTLIELSNRFIPFLSDNIIAARVGGDEFTFAIVGNFTKKEIKKFAIKIIKLCEEPVIIDEYKLHVSINIGIDISKDNCDITSLLKNADIAMYHTKENIGLMYSFYDEKLENKVKRKSGIEQLLKNIDFDEEFSICYQPQFKIDTKEIIGIEALIRWNNPIIGTISPVEFIDIAEECGMIIKIGYWVMKNAIKQVSYWNKKYNMNLVIGINVSPKQMNSMDFLDSLRSVISDNNINPKLIDIEITENIKVNEEKIILNTLKHLDEIGVSVSIDDFGTGYSSLSYIKRFSIDKLKIDKVLVDNISSDKGDFQVVKAIIMMAKGMDVKTIAEGVEDEKQLNILKELGCDEVQGYIWSKPLTPHEFEEKYLNGRLDEFI